MERVRETAEKGIDEHFPDTFDDCRIFSVYVIHYLNSSL